MKKELKKVFVKIEYGDGTSFSFDVECHSEKEYEITGEITLITRGTLMASGGCKAIAYNYDGFEICSYTK